MEKSLNLLYFDFDFVLNLGPIGRMFDKPNEVWVRVPFIYSAVIEVSNLGRFRSTTRRCGVRLLMAQTKRQIVIRGVCYVPSRVVCETFHGPAGPGEAFAVFLDGDKCNLVPENLAWSKVFSPPDFSTDAEAVASADPEVLHTVYELGDNMEKLRRYAATHEVSWPLIRAIRRHQKASR